MYDPNLRLYNCFKFTNKLPQPNKDPVFMNGTFLIYMTCYMTQYQLSGTILFQPECIAYWYLFNLYDLLYDAIPIK